jgi:hypothetical protein
MYAFGDGFDLYAASADAVAAGFWDSGAANFSLVNGRYTGSRALQNNIIGVWLTKASGSNDAVHHIVCAFEQITTAFSGTTLVLYFNLRDGTTTQCSIAFRSDGAILLYSGAGGTGTVLATYTGAVSLLTQWFAFEMEVVIHPTVGSFTVRTNGATSNSFQATGLNTRNGTTNNYANSFQLGQASNFNAQLIDDLLWRSDPSSVPWVGDIRCYTRMPASDVQKQFTPNSGATNYTRVNEAQQDAATSYVYDSNVGDADFYGIASIGVTPASTVAVTTRQFAEKSDAGSRSSAVQLKSGSTTVSSTSTALSTTWAWNWRIDLTDPATSAAWTAAGVNNVQVGPTVTA